MVARATRPIPARLPAIVGGACECEAMSDTPDYELIDGDDCPVCGRAGTIVTPDFCTDGHGSECPERMCVDCGSALLVGPPAPAVRRTA
jgi:hypothetical protein